MSDFQTSPPADTKLSFREELRLQRWDDHRYYHHSRINQSLHLLSASCFLTCYAMLFVNRGVPLSLKLSPERVELSEALPADGLAVKEGDLVAATQGRGYWILDDRGDVHAFGTAVDLGDVVEELLASHFGDRHPGVLPRAHPQEAHSDTHFRIVGVKLVAGELLEHGRLIDGIGGRTLRVGGPIDGGDRGCPHQLGDVEHTAPAHPEHQVGFEVHEDARRVEHLGGGPHQGVDVASPAVLPEAVLAEGLAVVGELTVERDFLSRGLGRLR